MRFLAHGGVSRADRSQFGTWPEIPSGLLLDVRGTASDSPAFGLGMLQSRPFLIHRQSTGADAPAYTFLLEPRHEDFERFHWNAAWLLASLLADPVGHRLLVEEPEHATADAITGLLDACDPVDLQAVPVPQAMLGQLTRAAIERGDFAGDISGLVPDGRPSCIRFAAALESVPVAFRTGRGWLVGGVETHAEILGCAVLFDGPGTEFADAAPGIRTATQLQEFAQSNGAVAHLLETPWSDWGPQGQGLIHGLKILDELETRPTQALELLNSMPAREGILAKEIRAAASHMMDDVSTRLDFAPTMLFLEKAEQGQRRVAESELERLDQGALVHYFSSRGVPPAPWPQWFEPSPSLKNELWTRAIATAKNGFADLVKQAFADIAPDASRSDDALDVALAGIHVARECGDDTLEWESFLSLPAYPELATPLAEWVRDDVRRMRGDWQMGYLVFGGDPGGRELGRMKLPGAVIGRLINALCDALEGPRSSAAGEWLDALATSPLRELVPDEAKKRLAATAHGEWAAEEIARNAEASVAASEEATAAEEKEKAGSGWLSGMVERLRASEPAPEAQPHNEPEEQESEEETATREPEPETDAVEPEEEFVAEAQNDVPEPPVEPVVTEEPEAPALPRHIEPLATPIPAEEPAEPQPVEAAQLPSDIEDRLTEWILGGDASDDVHADREMIEFLADRSAADMEALREVFAGLNSGLLYRLASRAAENPQLLESVSHAVTADTLDQIISDAADYDPRNLARQAAEHLIRHRQNGGSGAIGDALVRVLRVRQQDMWDALVQELRAIDETLLLDESTDADDPYRLDTKNS